jgi:hypothetical protein
MNGVNNFASAFQHLQTVGVVRINLGIHCEHMHSISPRLHRHIRARTSHTCSQPRRQPRQRHINITLDAASTQCIEVVHPSEVPTSSLVHGKNVGLKGVSPQSRGALEGEMQHLPPSAAHDCSMGGSGKKLA